MTAVASPGRIAWLDQARAAGILLVVVGHAIRSVERAGLEAGPILGAADRAIYTFHMPLFFILAGMTHALAGRRDAASAAKGLWWTIIWPYLLWSWAWIGLKTVFAGAANRAVDSGFVEILWQPVDHFWFLYVLLIVRLAWYLVDATGSQVAKRLAVLLPLAVAFVGAGPGNGVLDVWLLFWAAFYGVGIVAVTGLPGLSRPALLSVAAGSALVWLVVFSSTPRLLEDGFGIARTLAALSGSFLLLSAVALAAPGGRAGRIVGLVGEASLTIFLTHSIFGAMTRVALAKSGLLSPETLVIAATAAGIVLPVLLHLAVLAMAVRLGLPLMRWFGFGGATRSHYVDVAAPRRPAPGPAGA
jgi:fucose 4-O-acetylase-like acetyltransferase